MDAVGYALAKSAKDSLSLGSTWGYEPVGAGGANEYPAVANIEGRGKIFFSGGWTGAGSATITTKLWDTTTKVWTSVTAYPTSASYDQGCTCRSNGIVHVISGYFYNANTNSSNYIYDSATDTWTSKASMTNGGASGYRTTYRASDDSIYYFDASNAIRKYNPVDNTWSSLGAISGFAGNNSSIGILIHSNDKMYWYDPGTAKQMKELDLTSLTWTAKASYDATITPECRTPVETVDNLILYTHTSSSTTVKPVTYNPVTNTWDKTKFSSISGYTPYSRGLGVASLDDGRIWMGAGSEGGTLTSEGYAMDYPRPLKSAKMDTLLAYLASK